MQTYDISLFHDIIYHIYSHMRGHLIWLISFIEAMPINLKFGMHIVAPYYVSIIIL